MARLQAQRERHRVAEAAQIYTRVLTDRVQNHGIITRDQQAV